MTSTEKFTASTPEQREALIQTEGVVALSDEEAGDVAGGIIIPPRPFQYEKCSVCGAGKSQCFCRCPKCNKYMNPVHRGTSSGCKCTRCDKCDSLNIVKDPSATMQSMVYFLICQDCGNAQFPSYV